MRRTETFLAALTFCSLLAMLESSAATSIYAGFQMHEPLAFEQPSYGRQVAHRSKHRRTIRVTGVITDEGVECIALRGDDGRLYTLAGNAGGFEPGDRVRVIGRRADVSFCMQGTTIEVRHIFAAH
jgi:hypothetical protein